jgi:hypothetical protein
VRGKVTVIFRASDGRIEDPQSPVIQGQIGLSGKLEESLFLGSHYRHYIRIGEALVMVDSPETRLPGSVRLALDSGKVQVYLAAA